MQSISLDDPEFFQRVNATRPDLFDQEAIGKHIAEEKARSPMTKQDDETAKKIETIMDYWDFSPFQDEDSRRERVANEIEALIKEQVRLGKIEENDYHWHRQKNITEHAVNGVVSTYFLGRKAQLEQEGERQ